jgi:hypothetical protein
MPAVLRDKLPGFIGPCKNNVLKSLVIPTRVKRARASQGPISARFWREWADQRASSGEGPCVVPHNYSEACEPQA